MNILEIIAVIVVVVLVAFAVLNPPAMPAAQPNTGGNIGGNTQLANPASVNCVNKGGTLRMETNSAGQYGICVLKNGTECEEWAFFRGECPLPFDEMVAAQAQSFCSRENVASVYTCGDYVKVVSSLIGGGSTFYKVNPNAVVDDGIQCPVVSPDYMSDACKLLIMGNNCIETQVC